MTYRTVTRAIETNTLTRRMEDALKLRQLEAGGAAAEPVMRRLQALEQGQEELEAGLLMLAHAVGARLARHRVTLRTCSMRCPRANLGVSRKDRGSGRRTRHPPRRARHRRSSADGNASTGSRSATPRS